MQLSELLLHVCTWYSETAATLRQFESLRPKQYNPHQHSQWLNSLPFVCSTACPPVCLSARPLARPPHRPPACRPLSWRLPCLPAKHHPAAAQAPALPHLRERTITAAWMQLERARASEVRARQVRSSALGRAAMAGLLRLNPTGWDICNS